MGVTNADAFKRLFEGLYASELWSWSEDKFLEWLNGDYAGSALPEYFDRPVCKCCGKPIDHLMVNMFAYDGSDSFEKVALTYIEAVAPFVDKVKIGKLNYHPSDINWKTFGHEAERLCRQLGLDYTIKNSLRAEMEGTK